MSSIFIKTRYLNDPEKRTYYIVKSQKNSNTGKYETITLKRCGKYKDLVKKDPNFFQKIEAEKRRFIEEENRKNFVNRIKFTSIPNDVLVKMKSFQWSELLLLKLWYQSGLNLIFRHITNEHRIKPNFEKVVFALVADRILYQNSKHKTYERCKYNTPFDYSDCSKNDFYDTLAILASKKDNIIGSICRKLNKDQIISSEEVLYDVTTFFFESFDEELTQEEKQRQKDLFKKYKKDIVDLAKKVDSKLINLASDIINEAETTIDQKDYLLAQSIATEGKKRLKDFGDFITDTLSESNPELVNQFQNNLLSSIEDIDFVESLNQLEQQEEYSFQDSETLYDYLQDSSKNSSKLSQEASQEQAQGRVLSVLDKIFGIDVYDPNEEMASLFAEVQEEDPNAVNSDSEANNEEESVPKEGLRRRGFSKDNKRFETQVVFGLLCDKNGIPLNFEVFKGNESEQKTILGVIDKYAQALKLKNLTIMADAGLNAADNIRKFHELGYKYVVGFPPTNRADADLKSAILRDSGWVGANNETNYPKDNQIPSSLKVKKSGFRYKIIPYNLSKSKKEEPLRANFICYFSTTDFIRATAQISHNFLKTLNKYDKNLVGTDTPYTGFPRGKKNIILNTKNLEKRIELAGYNGIITNLDESLGIKPLEYKKQLWRIENNFRVMKTELETRPIYVRKNEHIKGHLCICYLALLLLKLLERKLKEKGNDASTYRIIDTLRNQSIIIFKDVKSNFKIVRSSIYLNGTSFYPEDFIYDEEGELVKHEQELLFQDILDVLNIKNFKNMMSINEFKNNFKFFLKLSYDKICFDASDYYFIDLDY